MKINVTTSTEFNHTVIRDRMVSLMWLPDPLTVISKQARSLINLLFLIY